MVHSLEKVVVHKHVRQGVIMEAWQEVATGMLIVQQPSYLYKCL